MEIKMGYKTCDISDQLHPQVQYLEPKYVSYGSKDIFSGRIVTVKCFEDNSFVRDALSLNGKDSVLVVDAGASMNCAMLGDQLASMAISNKWEGILINGLIRDSEQINQMDIGVRALGVHPLKSVKRGIGEKNLMLNFSGVNFTPDEYLYADEDGVVVVKEKVKI